MKRASKPLFRKGDSVIFEGKPHLIDDIGSRAYFGQQGHRLWDGDVGLAGRRAPLEEFLALIHPVGKTEQGLASAQQLAFSTDGEETPVTLARGFMGNPDQWCWWETEYPDEGMFGGYGSRDRALESIADAEKVARMHFHVSELVEPFDIDWLEPRTKLRLKPFRHRNQKLTGSDNRRFFTIDLISIGTRPEEERTHQFRIALIGAEPFEGMKHGIVVERLHKDTENNASWQPIRDGSIVQAILYWFLRRMVGLADRHRPIAKVGTLHELAGDIGGPGFSFVPSEEQ